MTKLWRSLLGRDTVSRFTLDEHLANIAAAQEYGVLSYGSSPFQKTEDVENSLIEYIQRLYKSDGIVFAVMAARGWLFSEARFAWQELNDGRPGDLFWTPELEVLDNPWPNATTGEMLIRMEQDSSLAGAAVIIGEENDGESRLRRLQPDWVTVVLTAPPAEATRADIAGFWYHPGRTYSNVEKPDLERDEVFLPGEVCYWTPIPDPAAQFRGMSWLTPVVREILGDKAATEHKLNFFKNGATFGPIISARENLTKDQFADWSTNLSAAHVGVGAAYRPLFLASPVDVNVRGLDLKQLDFKATQGAGETRIAAAGRVHPSIVGLSEGMQGSSLNAGNYGAAKRNLGDGTMRPLWRSVSAALSPLVGPSPRPARLWYDDRDIAFLRDDRQDIAKIQSAQAATMKQLIDAAFTPESVVSAVNAEDWTLLKHTGIPTVQVQQVTPPPAPGDNGQQNPEQGPVERHLPGRHNQKSHGNRLGVKAVASKFTRAQFEAMLPDRVWSERKRGEILAELRSTPEGKVLADTLDRFQDGGSIARLRTVIEKRLAGDYVPAASAARADAIVDALRNAPTDLAPDTLYRGISLRGSVDSVIAKYAPGSDLDLNLTSFSTDRGVATRFHQMTASKGNVRVYVELVGGGKRLLPIQNLARDRRLFGEKEWVGGGKFQVVSAKKSGSGGVTVRIEQVGEL